MTGFGNPQKQEKSIEQGASSPQTQEAIKQSILKYQQGDLENAKIILEKTLEAEHANSFALGFLATLEKALGNNERALKLFKRSTNISQDNPDILHNYSDLLKQHDLKKALILSNKSVHISPENSRYLERNGYLKWKSGDLKNALEVTLKALRIDPSLFDAHMNLSGIYNDLGNLNQALASTLKALELKADNPDALMNLGSIYKDLGRIEDATKTFNQVLKSTTKDTEKLTTILNFYDSTNKVELLEESITYIKSALPSPSLRLKMYEARALFRRKEYKESWERLPTLHSASKGLHDWFSIAKYHEFRAQIAEKNNQYDTAYYSFEASQIDPQYKLINHKQEYARIHEYITLSKNISKDKERIALRNQTQCDSRPIFLAGFPRSGTTLLDTILRSHPNIEVLEEKDARAFTEDLGTKKLQTRISNFNNLKQDDLNTMRELYFSRIKYHSSGSDKLIIDKLPLHTIAVPLINLLFPNAKVIFALRHPCDTILSCFQQIFKPNAAMANFTNLDRSVEYYDRVMSGWRTYNENMNIDHTISKYEDLLDNFDESILKLLKELNLPWDERVRDYRNTAMTRKMINTPSSSQVVQPLYKSSLGRWKNYEKYFAKHMNKLNPWINYFGYNM